MSLYTMLRHLINRWLDPTDIQPPPHPAEGLGHDSPGELPPDLDYCPEHDADHPWGTHCAACVEEWHARARLDFADWVEQLEADDLAAAEARAAEHDARSDGWYLDLVARASFPHSDWRD